MRKFKRLTGALVEREAMTMIKDWGRDLASQYAAEKIQFSSPETAVSSFRENLAELSKKLEETPLVYPIHKAGACFCYECKYADAYERADGETGYYCHHKKNSFIYGERMDRVFNPVKESDDFCSYGEKEEKQ